MRKEDVSIEGETFKPMGDIKSCSSMEGKEKYRKLDNKFNKNDIELNLCYRIKTYTN